ncbi:MAG: hypothetical protein ISR99_02005 [Parcubacteria group bacterium]|nr:hypothetical protein [Parcubacteria group bacterium]
MYKTSALLLVLGFVLFILAAGTGDFNYEVAFSGGVQVEPYGPFTSFEEAVVYTAGLVLWVIAGMLFWISRRRAEREYERFSGVRFGQ